MWYKMLRRKPSKWAVGHDGREGTVEKTGDTARGRRWRDDGGRLFPSRRAAFYFFETGHRFTTTPVYAVINGRRGTKRSR